MAKDEQNASNARQEAEIFDELAVLCTSPGYIHAIAYFCWRDNIIGFADGRINEVDLQHQYSNDRLIRTEISTLIGLMAKGPVDVNVPAPEILQSYITRSEVLLHEMHLSLQKPWIAAFKKLASNPTSGIDPFNTAEGLREPIFYGGESAYNFQYRELAKLKYASDNDWLNTHKGFTIDEATSLFSALSTLQIDKIVALRRTRDSSLGDQDTFLPGFRFSSVDLERTTGISRQKIEHILDSFSFDQNSRNTSFTSLSEYNATNSTPILKLEDNSYILLQHYSIFEALYETPFYWMAGDKDYRVTASKNRGLFTENFLASRLASVFGENNVVTNIDIYHGKNRVGEIDILVRYGGILLIVQAKSKKLTIEARKGNDFQLKDDFKKAIQDAYDQALVCSEAVFGEGYRFVRPSGEEYQLPSQVHHIFPFCIVSDHYPALAAQARQFLKITETINIKPPIVSDLFFMDVATEILNSPLHFINYLTLRAKFDKKLLVSQELTNLGYHLSHNLWVDDKYDMMNLGDDFTGSLDIAMLARRSGVPGEKIPRGILTRHNGTPIGALLDAIEENGDPELVGLGLLFLQIGSESARHINNGITQLVRTAAVDGRPHDFSVPAGADKSGFTIHVNALNDSDARQRLAAHCQVKKYETKADTWHGLLLAPGTGDIRAAFSTRGEWKKEASMEELLRKWPKKSPTPIRALSLATRKPRIGRNDLCPCGSGKKYKKCCLGS